MGKLSLVSFQTPRTENYRARTRTRGPGIQYRGWSRESPWRPANLRQNCLPDWRCGPWRTTETRRSDYSCEWREPGRCRPRVCSVYVEENQGKNYSYSAFISQGMQSVIQSESDFMGTMCLLRWQRPLCKQIVLIHIANYINVISYKCIISQRCFFLR